MIKNITLIIALILGTINIARAQEQLLPSDEQMEYLLDRYVNSGICVDISETGKVKLYLLSQEVRIICVDENDYIYIAWIEPWDFWLTLTATWPEFITDL